MDPTISQVLQRVCLEPTSKASFTSKIDVIYKAARKLVPSITRQDVKEWRKLNAKVQITRQTRSRFPRVPIFAREENQCWAADSAFLPSLAKKNPGNSTIIVVLDVFTRKCYARTCKTASSKAAATIFRDIFDEAKATPKSLFTDLGE